MTHSSVTGRVAEVWRFPVKSMKGESLPAAEIGPLGVLGDRAYALIDAETGRVVSAKSVKLYPRLFDCQARYVAAPRRGEPLPAVEIALPEGRRVRSDAADVDAVLSAFFGRAVILTQSAPADFVIDQYHPDVEGADFAGHRNVVVAQRLGASLFAELGMASPVPAGLFFDAFPISVITRSTLAHLGELAPQSRFDARRFRMNLVLETTATGFVENAWIGQRLSIGAELQLGIAMPDPRCVMTTLAQDDLPKDVEVLRALVRHNRLPVGTLGQLPCAGVYALVGQPGSVSLGDAVQVHAG